MSPRSQWRPFPEGTRRAFGERQPDSGITLFRNYFGAFGAHRNAHAARKCAGSASRFYFYGGACAEIESLASKRTALEVIQFLRFSLLGSDFRSERNGDRRKEILIWQR